MTIFREAVPSRIEAMKNDPALFCAEVLETRLYPWQEEFLRWLEKRERVCVPLGEKP